MNNSPLYLSPSRWLSAILMLIGLVAVLSVWFLALFWLIQLIVSVMIVIWTWYAIQRYAWLKSSKSWLGIRLGERQQLFALHRAGEVAFTLHADTVVTPFFVLLRMKVHEKTSLQTMIIMPDACHQDDFRRWRVWLLWGIRPHQLESN
jgi:hypothetical protein